jgi:hypothetical protein
MPTTFAAENSLTTAVGDLSETGALLRVFPNPASGRVQVSVGEQLADADIRLLDARGVLLQAFQFEAFNATEISVADLPAGVFFLSVFSGGKPYGVQKLLAE